MYRPDHLSPPRIFTSFHPHRPELLIQDLVTPNIPQIYDSPMDIYISFMWSFTHSPLLFSTVDSRITALTVPYDNHVMYAFMLTFHLFQKRKQCHSHIVCKCTIISMDYMKYFVGYSML
jgi:hypothetical protein